MLLLFSGANLDISTLPKWMQMISNLIPLTRGIASTRKIIAGGEMSTIYLLLIEELGIGLIFTILGFMLFSIFESKAKKLGTLEIF